GIKKNVSDLFPPDVARNFLRHTKNALRDERSVTYEYQLSGSANKISHFEARFVKSDEKEVLCIIREITDTVKAKEEIKSAKEFYESIINNVNIDIAVFDEKNRYLLISKSAVKDDKLREWLIGKDDFDYCRARDRH